MVVLLALSVQASPLSRGADEVRTEVVYDMSQTDDPYVAVLAGMGHYFRDNLLLGGYVSWEKKSWSSYWGVTDLWELGIYGEYDYLRYEKVVPFVGLSMGLVDGDLPKDDTIFMAKVTGGLKYFINDVVAIALNLNVEMSGEEVFNYDRESDTVGSGENVGYSVALGARSVF